MSVRTVCLLLGSLGAAAPLAAQAGVNLSELTTLAKTRAAKLRPELEKQLKPFLEVLSRDYKSQKVVIDETITQVVKLGDAIIPILLEHLEPQRESRENRNLAANCARALATMEPASFVDSLLEIAQGENYTGIGLAIPLLGQTGSPRAGTALTTLLDRFDKLHARAAVHALTELKHKGAVLKIAKRLPYEDDKDDRAAMAYLKALQAPAVVPEVIRALGEVKRPPEIMRYVRLIGDCARQDPNAAHALLPFLDNQKLDRPYWTEIVEILADVAPPGDKESIAQLQKLLDSPMSPSRLELQAARTLRILGDSEGPKNLQSRLEKLTRGVRTKSIYQNWSNLGHFYLDAGDYRNAALKYRKATKTANRPDIRSELWIWTARAEARRPSPTRTTRVVQALKESGASQERLKKAAAEDEVLAEVLETPKGARFMESFNK